VDRGVVFLLRTVLRVLLLCAVLLCRDASAKEIRLAHLNPQRPFEVATAAMAQVFKSMVEEGSGGSLQVVLLPEGQPGNERECMEQVRAGVLQSYIASAGGIAPFYPLVGVLDIPFAIRDFSVAWRVYDGPFGDFLRKDILTKSGFRVLGFGEAGGFFQISNNKRPILSPKDMEGLRVRIMAIPSHENLMRAFGAVPVVMPWSEVRTALETGVVDGQHNPIPILLAGELQTLQRYLTLSNHLYSVYFWVMNDEFYRTLTQEERRVVNEAARVAIVAGRGLNRILEASGKGRALLEEAGMRIDVLSPEATEAFRRIGRTSALTFLAESFGEEGQRLAERYLDAIGAAEREAAEREKE
jgi:tripartite ATP-independent transporter DctP family solute receptor